MYFNKYFQNLKQDNGLLSPCHINDFGDFNREVFNNLKYRIFPPYKAFVT